MPPFAPAIRAPHGSAVPPHAKASPRRATAAPSQTTATGKGGPMTDGRRDGKATGRRPGPEDIQSEIERLRARLTELEHEHACLMRDMPWTERGRRK